MALTDYFGRVEVGGHEYSTEAVLAGLEALLDELRPARIDRARSEIVNRSEFVDVRIAHTLDPDLSVEVALFGDEIVVSYGVEHEHFNVEHEDVSYQVGPFLAPGMVPKVIGFLRALITGRVVLEVTHRLVYVKTRSYWINEDGERELFLSGGTVIPTLRWTPEPRILTFDFGSRSAD